MAAVAAKPSGAQINGNNNNNNGGNSNSGAQENANGGSLSQTALRHNPGLARDWTTDEQSTLEDLLTKYASETNVVRYSKIAQALKDKTVRDVALRCRWMNKKENGKRRKYDRNSRKNKEKKLLKACLTRRCSLWHLPSPKEKGTDPLPKSSQITNRTNGPAYAQSMLMDSDDGISYDAIGGATGEILEQNAHALDQISANFSSFKIHENIDLFSQARTNILSILNDFNDLPEIMRQMPPLPVKLNEELASSILPPMPLPNKS